MFQISSQDIKNTKTFLENFLPLKRKAEAASGDNDSISRILDGSPEENAMRAMVLDLPIEQLRKLVGGYYTLRRNIDQTSVVPEDIETWNEGALASKITGTQAVLLERILKNS